MLQEDEQLPDLFAPDLKKIHAGGRQLLALIAEYFDEETFETKRGDVHRLCHDLRTPVNQIIGYSEILQEEAEETGRKKWSSCLGPAQKIRDAALSWLGLMEEHLLPAGSGTDAASASASDLAWLPNPICPASRFNRRPPATQQRSCKAGPVAGCSWWMTTSRTGTCWAGRLQRDGYTIQLAANGGERQAPPAPNFHSI